VASSPPFLSFGVKRDGVVYIHRVVKAGGGGQYSDGRNVFGLGKVRKNKRREREETIMVRPGNFLLLCANLAESKSLDTVPSVLLRSRIFPNPVVPG
jgi:hypothetical protein